MTFIVQVLIPAALIGALLVIAIAIVENSVRRCGLFGLNLERTVCSRCGREQPFLRVPNTVRQLLFGGFTCRGCGAELDKWGRCGSTEP